MLLSALVATSATVALGVRSYWYWMTGKSRSAPPAEPPPAKQRADSAER